MRGLGWETLGDIVWSVLVAAAGLWGMIIVVALLTERTP